MKKLIKKRIVVTGAGGFIGSSLVERLVALGCYNIVAIDRNATNFEKIKNITTNFSDEKKMRKIIQKDDIVIHFACSSNPAISQQDAIKDIEENVIGSLKLLQICVEKKISKLVYISSGGVIYGNQGARKMKESGNSDPISLHGVMKLTIEKYIQAFGHLFGLNYVIVRPGNPYGRKNSNNRNQGIVDVFISKINNNENLEIWGDGKIIRDYIYIDDLIALIVETLNPKILKEIFNAGTGVGTSINEIVDILKRVSGKNFRAKYFKKRNFDILYNVLNMDKAKGILKWKPKKNLEENIKQIIIRR